MTGHEQGRQCTDWTWVVDMVYCQDMHSKRVVEMGLCLDLCGRDRVLFERWLSWWVKARHGLKTLEYCRVMSCRDEAQTRHWVERWGTDWTQASDIGY